jgi:6-phosphogluconolactonase
MWLRDGRILEENIHPMETLSQTAQQGAASYEQVLRKCIGKATGLDVAVLGVGPDGHVCSLFPGHAALDEEQKWVAAVTDSPKPPSERLTLTLPALRATGHIFVAAVGEAKAEVIRRSLQPDCALPLARVIQQCRSVTLVLDKAAAATL